MIFTVVTKVNGPNMATAFGDLFVKTNDSSPDTDWLPTYERAPIQLGLNLYTPVWKLGEIVVLDDNDRTIPDGRKPSKWFIDTEAFDTIEEAVARSRQVTES